MGSFLLNQKQHKKTVVFLKTGIYNELNYLETRRKGMLKIAICDTNRQTHLELQRLLKNVELCWDYQLSFFANPSDLFIESLKLNSCYQVLIINDKLEEERGSEVVKQLKVMERSPEYVIVMIDSLEEVFSIFEVGATDCLARPLSAEKLRDSLNRIWQLITEKNSPYILVKDRYTKEMVYLRQREIVYFEMEDSSQRLLKIVTSQKEIYIYSRLGDFIGKLKGDWFIKIYRSIYVNRQHIQKFSKKELLTTTDSWLPIGSRYYEELLRKLVKHSEKE